MWNGQDGKKDMYFNDLLRNKGIDPEHVLVFRHRPSEPQLDNVLPWLAAEKPHLFNAYQQIQSNEKLEGAIRKLVGKGYIASFIGREAGKALFVGLYSIGKAKSLTYDEYWNIAANAELSAFGMKGFTGEKRSSILYFDSAPLDFYASWKGKLIVLWPGSERSWWRRAHFNEIPIHAIIEDSALDAAMPEWNAIDLTWPELRILPMRLKSALSQWRGIYYIFDVSDGRGYVGSAYGKDNLLSRWLAYAARGHGGNRSLKPRDPNNFRFTILERVSPDMESSAVIQLESTWKQRLHTRQPYGLNDN